MASIEPGRGLPHKAACCLVFVVLIVWISALQAVAHEVTGIVTTPSSAVRLYELAINQGQCDLAYKVLSPGSRPFPVFRQDCRATQHLSVSRLLDPAYRVQRLTATYTCLGVHLTTRYRTGPSFSSGGWYLLEKTTVSWWHILLARSHLVSNGRAHAPSRGTCTASLPRYTRSSSAQIISGSDFVSAATGWVALSRSGAYVPNGTCEHGIGTNCNTARTAIYRTNDGGAHWQPQIALRTVPGPLVWMHFFSTEVGLAAISVGPATPFSAYARSILLHTVDGGRHWDKLPLPQGYSVDTRSITFPDPKHGWLWFGRGAMGSMSVEMHRTSDGGKHWLRVACATFTSPLRGPGCTLHSGIGFGGDKEFLTFSNSRDGWFTIFSNAGIPTLLHSRDGGRTWHDQHLALPPGVRLPGPKDTVFPMGTFDAPHLFGRDGILTEIFAFFQPKQHTSWAHQYLFRSKDAGRSWHLEKHMPVPVPSVSQYLDAQHWIFVAGSTIWMTHDGSRTWKRYPTHTPQNMRLTVLAFTDPHDGWAIGLDARRALLRTSDGGRTWRQVKLPGADK